MTERARRADFPSWLIDIAVDVDEWMADPAVLDRFRDMLRDWYVEHKSHDPVPPVNRDGSMRYNDDKFRPRRRVSMAGKYARLAAIHDEVCEKTKRVDLWKNHKALRTLRFPQIMAGNPYFKFCYHGVKDIQDDDRGRIEKWRNDVRADLATRATAGSKSQPATTAIERRKIAGAARSPSGDLLTESESAAIEALSASDDWIKARDAARTLGIATRTLATYRSGGRRSPDKLCGIDHAGRVWRKASANAHPLYFRPSLNPDWKFPAKP